MSTVPAAGPARAPLCAAAARVRGDALIGSVPTTRRWLLLEHPGPWQHDALGGLGLPAPVLDPLVAAIRAQGARALLVRRPGRTQPAPDRAWGVLDQRSGAVRWGRWSAPEDLLDAAAALAEDVVDGEPGEQVLLVCTHGRHDTCCAVWGRPVAAALAQRWPEQTWECSHLGGDRFAANVLVAPDGLYYGRLDGDTAVDVVAAHLRGEVDPTFLRGFSDVPPVVQAAVGAVHARFGPAPARGVRATDLQVLATDTWSVQLVADAPLPARVSAVVTRGRQAPAVLTCGAGAPSTAAVFTVSDVVAVPPQD